MTFRRPAPFRLQAPDRLSSTIHEVCASALARLLAPPAMWACYPAGAVELTAAQHARYARMGLKRGMPDILIFHRGLWGIEIKRRGGRLSRDAHCADPPRLAAGARRPGGDLSGVNCLGWVPGYRDRHERR